MYFIDRRYLEGDLEYKDRPSLVSLRCRLLSSHNELIAVKCKGTMATATPEEKISGITKPPCLRSPEDREEEATASEVGPVVDEREVRPPTVADEEARDDPTEMQPTVAKSTSNSLAIGTLVKLIAERREQMKKEKAETSISVTNSWDGSEVSVKFTDADAAIEAAVEKFGTPVEHPIELECEAVIDSRPPRARNEELPPRPTPVSTSDGPSAASKRGPLRQKLKGMLTKSRHKREGSEDSFFVFDEQKEEFEITIAESPTNDSSRKKGVLAKLVPRKSDTPLYKKRQLGGGYLMYLESMAHSAHVETTPAPTVAKANIPEDEAIQDAAGERKEEEPFDMAETQSQERATLVVLPPCSVPEACVKPDDVLDALAMVVPEDNVEVETRTLDPERVVRSFGSEESFIDWQAYARDATAIFDKLRKPLLELTADDSDLPFDGTNTTFGDEATVEEKESFDWTSAALQAAEKIERQKQQEATHQRISSIIENDEGNKEVSLPNPYLQVIVDNLYDKDAPVVDRGPLQEDDTCIEALLKLGLVSQKKLSNFEDDGACIICREKGPCKKEVLFELMKSVNPELAAASARRKELSKTSPALESVKAWDDLLFCCWTC